MKIFIIKCFDYILQIKFFCCRAVADDGFEVQNYPTCTQADICFSISALPREVGSGPRYQIFVARFCMKQVQFSHVHVFSDLCNVQKGVTQIIYLWPLPIGKEDYEEKGQQNFNAVTWQSIFHNAG